MTVMFGDVFANKQNSLKTKQIKIALMAQIYILIRQAKKNNNSSNLMVVL